MSALLTLLLQIVVVLVAARVAAAAFQRFKQPAVVGEMAAGLMLGPSILGKIAPDVSLWLFPPASLSLLNAVSQFGLVVFMFIVGSRLDLGHLRRNRQIVLLTSYVSMLLPFALGVGLGCMLLTQSALPPEARLPFVLFVGLSLSVTAFPVLVRIVNAHDLAATRLGTIAVACAAFGDVTAWVALALVTSLAHTGEVPVAATLLRLGTYAAAMLLVARPLLRACLRRLDGRAALVVLLTAAAISAIITNWIGIHALFGSFFLGALMSSDMSDRGIRTNRIEPVTVLLIVPLFFAFTGLRTDIRLISSPLLAAQALGILAVAVLGKAAGPILTGRRMGLTRQETMALGVLLNTRGLVELVVLNIGYEAGLLSPALFTMLTVMALATTAMASPLLSALGYPAR